MEQISIKELIDEVAKRHGIILDGKDPILVTLTLNELIIENYVKAVEASISKINARQIENAKLVGAEIITKGAKYLIAEYRTPLPNIERKEICNDNSQNRFKFDYIGFILAISLLANIASTWYVFATK